MTVNPDCIIKSFDILKYERISMSVITDIKSVESFSFNQGMKGFHTCVIVWIVFMRVVTLHELYGFSSCR